MDSMKAGRQDGAALTMPEDALLSVRELSVVYHSRRGLVRAVREVSFDLRDGENLALIGESGCGKTTLGLALIRLLAKSARIVQGRILYRRGEDVVDLLTLSPQEVRRFRWSQCAMVFQAALNAFNPVIRIWDQIYETARAHGKTDRKAVREEAMELLRLVQLDPRRVIDAYPHELSGGMRQRVLIALSLLLRPKILILDEPTTALDILTQRTIIELLRRLKEEFRFSMIFISHDLALAAELADRVATMYAGRIVELAGVYAAFARPKHPYTRALIQTVPTVHGGHTELRSIPGSPPHLITPPQGCRFHPRCAFAAPECQMEDPNLMPAGEGDAVACWRWQAIQSAPGEAAAR